MNAYADKSDNFTVAIKLTGRQGMNLIALNLIMSYISTHVEDATQNLTLATYHRNLALRVLLRGLKDIGSLMRTKNPSDLNTALHMLTNDFHLKNTPNKNFKPKTIYTRQPLMFNVTFLSPQINYN